jgi:hypothetical protein
MGIERRRHPRRPSFRTQPELSVQLGAETFTARLVDSNDEGFGLETGRHLGVGSRIRVRGQLLTATGAKVIEVDGLVRWSVPGPSGCYFAGVAVDRSSPSQGFHDDGEQDYYEVLQVSPNADPDTVHRVFRALAQRFHPDNVETGDEAWFKVLVRAYEALSDPQRRAAYDAKRPARQQARWRIFDRAEAARGIEAERRKRHGILSLLYIRRANDPIHPAMGLHEFEQLLGCPREHLEFALWFLKENAWITRGDNGRYAITAKGVERAEEMGDLPLVGEDRMIEAPAAR